MLLTTLANLQKTDPAASFRDYSTWPVAISLSVRLSKNVGHTLQSQRCYRINDLCKDELTRKSAAGLIKRVHYNTHARK